MIAIALAGFLLGFLPVVLMAPGKGVLGRPASASTEETPEKDKSKAKAKAKGKSKATAAPQLSEEETIPAAQNDTLLDEDEESKDENEPASHKKNHKEDKCQTW
jgi:hypothetical protein